MTSVCTTCGLPQELCVCEQIAKESQQIVVKLVKKKFGKNYTVIEGLQDINIKEIAKNLKNKLACGGTAKGGYIELQGNHLFKVQEYLVQMGFPAETIQIKER
ncbi:MAG: translation initiation factor [Candidatus Woesearchaeota archaeon]